VLALYTYWRSSASYRVRIALGLKGLDYEARFVHLLKGEHITPEYRAVNPQARVPTLVHDGKVITQSLAIIEYLDEQFPGVSLMPQDSAGRARVRSLSQLISSEIQPMQNIGTTDYLKARMGCSGEQIEVWRKDWIERGMEALETRLANEAGTGEFTHGSAPTMADCVLVPQCYATQRFGVELKKYPTVARINDACLRLAGFQRAAPENQADRG
jgi:maleylacetoacetate isomerase